MASRKTIEEANELKAKFQAQYPDATFRIEAVDIDKAWGSYYVLEARTCKRCGSEYLTAGVGEMDNGLCADCEKAHREELEAESKRRQEENRRRDLQQKFYDKHMI